MRTKLISGITIFLCLGVVTPNANAQFLKKLLKGVVSAVVGYTSSEIENALPEECREGWRDISSSISSDFGLDNSYVNAGSNWQQGKKNDAILDLAEGVAVSTGTNNTFVVSSILDLGRAQNNYSKNIASGMSIEEATEIRNREWRQYTDRIYDEYMMSDKDRDELYRYNEMKYAKDLQEQDKAIRHEIWEELLKRGYSVGEAQVYMIIIDENPGLLSGLYSEGGNSIYMTGIMLTGDTNIQNMIKDRAKTTLNNLNISDRTNEAREDSHQPDENGFFGTKIATVRSSNEPSAVSAPSESEPSVIQPSEITKKPVDNLAEIKTRLKEIATDRYLINHVGLNRTQKDALDEVASLMNQYTSIRICLNGNTCDLGSDYINKLIAIKRASIAKEYLVKQGIDENRIRVESRAASTPVADGKTKEDRLKNRRVNITIIDD